MKWIVLFLIYISTLFSSQNPIVYAALGDIIYNNAPRIEKLQQDLQLYDDTFVGKYIDDVYETKKMGFAIQNGDENIDKMKYLKKLRKLSKTNDFFIRDIERKFEKSLKQDDVEFVNIIINSKLVDIKRYEKDILKYYEAHKNRMNTSGVIDKLLSKQNKKYKVKKIKNKKRLSKAELEKEKIKRLREKDKQKQEALQKALEEEVRKKKQLIREQQLKELRENK